MKTAAATLLAIAALTAGAIPALGQDEETELPPTIMSNTEFCSMMAIDVATCEGILAGMVTARILPEAFAGMLATDSSEEATEDQATTTGALGDTLVRDDLQITLKKADWKPDSSDAFYKPGKGNKYVSILVEYQALADGATYNITFWDATDKAGKRYEATVLGPITPDLKVGDLKAAETVEGWVTYEVPKSVNQLTFIESQVLKDDLSWTSKGQER